MEGAWSIRCTHLGLRDCRVDENGTVSSTDIFVALPLETCDVRRFVVVVKTVSSQIGSTPAK
jgi:hypothetical protein